MTGNEKNMEDVEYGTPGIVTYSSVLCNFEMTGVCDRHEMSIHVEEELANIATFPHKHVSIRLIKADAWTTLCCVICVHNETKHE